MPEVVDASLALAWHFEDEASEYADRVLERLREDRAAAPSIWSLEVANALLGLSDESLNAVLNLACRLRHLEGLPSPD